MTRLLTVVVVWLVIATPAFAQDVARMEEIIQGYVQKRTFMGSVLVARDGDILLNKGYGMANVEWDVPNSPATKFRVGSITKQFTAASILLLEQRGLLKTTDPIKKYFPEAPAAWDPITLHHLLTHTSGIPNFTASPSYATLRVTGTTIDKTIATFKDSPLDFPVGEKMAYSNSGYLVLGYVIEKVSGQSYASFLEENIFKPLSMNDSGYDSNTRVIPRRANGYSPAAGGPDNASYVNMTVPHAAGALYSTTGDMLTWERALLGGKVVSPASLEKMLTPEKNNYAYGLIVRTLNNRKQIWHNGGINGFNSSLAHYPDSKFTIVVLANLNGPVADQLLAQLGAVVHGDPVTLPQK